MRNAIEIWGVVVRLLSAAGMVVLPFFVLVIISKRVATNWHRLGFGAVTFITSQALHEPFNCYILEPAIKSAGLTDVTAASGSELALLSILYGLSAGILEESTRFVMYRCWIRRFEERTKDFAYMYGLGYGGCESIIMGLLASMSLTKMITLWHDDTLASFPDYQVEHIKLQVKQYWEVKWYYFIMPFFERLYALAAHISAAVMIGNVFFTPTTPRYHWLAMAIFYHTVLDAASIYCSLSLGVYLTDIILGVTTLPISYCIISCRSGSHSFVVSKSSDEVVSLVRNEEDPQESDQTPSALEF